MPKLGTLSKALHQGAAPPRCLLSAPGSPPSKLSQPMLGANGDGDRIDGANPLAGHEGVS